MRSTVSVRWQTVIPQEAREALKLEPNSKLEWEVKDGFLIVHPIPTNPIRPLAACSRMAGRRSRICWPRGSGSEE
jgi:AbrB family looped-hinge helix DNA binding protein